MLVDFCDEGDGFFVYFGYYICGVYCEVLYEEVSGVFEISFMCGFGVFVLGYFGFL